MYESYTSFLPSNTVASTYLLLSHISTRVTMRWLPGSPAPDTPPGRSGWRSRHHRRFPKRRCRKPPRDPRCVFSYLQPIGAESWACPEPAGGQCTAPALAPGSPVGSLGVHTGLGPDVAAQIDCSRTGTERSAFCSHLRRRRREEHFLKFNRNLKMTQTAPEAWRRAFSGFGTHKGQKSKTLCSNSFVILNLLDLKEV